MVAGLALVWLAGCASTAPATHAPATPGPLHADAVEHQLRTHEQRWRGTPYRWGGTSRNGIDCSGFVMAAYRDLFGVALPRTTDAQAQTGRPVSRTAVQTGDLVFFRPSGKSRHVGIYLGNHEFAHASTSNGVMISRLDEPYWQGAYWTSRRVLPMPLAQTQSASSPTPARDLPAARRSGW